ncbi:MAG: DUF4870 domain-containing protein [Bacteroidales bacterium]|nr:DUF4870 domain-containing protein [Bacteroidales bacterium]
MSNNNWAMLCHLSALAMFVFPLGNVLGPLIVWLLKKEEMPLVEREGKEALNFQITISLFALVAGLLTFILIGIPLLVLIGLVNLVFIVLAALEASNGRPYTYPFNLRLIK